jgi:hypothetical protein
LATIDFVYKKEPWGEREREKEGKEKEGKKN